MLWLKFWQRIRHYRGQFVLLAILQMFWVAYVSWLPLFYHATNQAWLQHQLTELEPLAHTLTLTHPTPLNTTTHATLQTHLEDAIAHTHQTVTTDGVVCGERKACLRLASYDTLTPYLEVVLGRAPQSQRLSVVLEGMISKSNAVLHGYQVGDILQIGLGKSLILIEIVGLVEPLDATDTFWEYEIGILSPIETLQGDTIRPDLTVLLDWDDFHQRLMPSLTTWTEPPRLIWHSYLELNPQIILENGFNRLYERIHSIEATLLDESIQLENPLPHLQATHQQQQTHLLIQLCILSVIAGGGLLLGLDLSLHALLSYENIDWQVLHQPEMSIIRKQLHQRFQQIMIALGWSGVGMGWVLALLLAIPWRGYHATGASLIVAVIASVIGVAVVANGGYGKVWQQDRSAWVRGVLLSGMIVLLLSLLFSIGQVWWIGRELDNGILQPFRAGVLALPTQPFGVARGLGITLHATLTLVIGLVYGVGSIGLQRNPREYNQKVVRQTLSDWQSYWKNRLYTLMMGLTLTSVLVIGGVVGWNQTHHQLWKLAYQLTGADLRVSLVNDVSTDLVLDALPNVTRHSTLLEITEQQRNSQPLRVLGVNPNTIQPFFSQIDVPAIDAYQLSGGILLANGVSELAVDVYSAYSSAKASPLTLTAELTDWRGIPFIVTLTPSSPPSPRQFIPYRATLPLGVEEPLMWHNLTLTPTTQGEEYRVLLDAVRYTTQTEPSILIQGFEGEGVFVAPQATRPYQVQSSRLVKTDGEQSLQVSFVAPITLELAPTRWESIPLLMSEWLAFQQPPNGIVSFRVNGKVLEIPYQRVGVVSGVFGEQERGIIATLDDLLPTLNRQVGEGDYFVPNVALLSLADAQANPSLRDVLQNHAALSQPFYAIDTRQTLSQNPLIWVGGNITMIGAMLVWCSWIITVGVNIRAMRQVGRVARFGLVILAGLLIGGGIGWFYGGWVGWLSILNGA